MKKITCALLLLSSFGAFAQTANQAILQNSLKPWQPLSIDDTEGVVTLTMNEDRISNTIYEAVVKGSICAPVWFEDKKTAFLKNTKEIRVLNKHSWSGMVFENPRASCDEVGKAMDGDDKVIIMSHTHMHSNRKAN